MSSSSSESWSVVVFTDFPGVALLIRDLFAKHGHRVVGLVTSPKRNPNYLEVARGLPPEVDVLISTHPRRWAAMLAPLRPDLIVSSVFPHRVPDDVLRMPRLGAVNVHPALLPKYRGTSTLEWLVRNDEREIGMTLHRMVSGFDAGPILSQVSTTLDDDDDIAAVIEKLQSLVEPLWERALPRIAAGDPGDPQDESQASYYAHISDDESWWGIDWNKSAREVHNQVRSCGMGLSVLGAVGTIDGTPYRIHHTHIVSEGEAPAAPVGSFVYHGENGSGPRVQCGDGVLELVRYEPIEVGTAS